MVARTFRNMSRGKAVLAGGERVDGISVELVTGGQPDSLNSALVCHWYRDWQLGGGGAVLNDSSGGVAGLRSEIVAFYSGFGQPQLLAAAFEQAVVLVPVTADDRLMTSEYGGVHWLCVFTGEVEFARFQAERTIIPDREYRFHWLRGWRLSEYAAEQAEPTGILVDALSAAPIAFPPTVPEDSKPVAEVR
ncbi:hypothetical protein [Nocardia nova]|uniref:hypothetical protein n=1 Tax=Nocardia nova TaxID=37330 RepID=UPI00340277C3